MLTGIHIQLRFSIIIATENSDLKCHVLTVRPNLWCDRVVLPSEERMEEAYKTTTSQDKTHNKTMKREMSEIMAFGI